MPENRIWRGDAAAVSQVVKITPAQVEVGDLFTITINGKDISYTCAVATIDNVVEGLVAAWNSSSIPEATEITAAAVDSDDDGDADYLTLTADVPGVPFRVATSTTNSAGGNVTVAETTKGVTGVDERQKVELVGTYSGGTFALSWDPGGGTETTSGIAYNASAGTVQTALEGLASVSSGDVSVSGAAGGPWYVTFEGSYSETDVALMSIDGSSLTGSNVVDIETITPGTAVPNEIQFLQVNEQIAPISGTYTLTFDGETTSGIAYNASAAAVQTALEGLATIGSGNVEVSGGEGVTDGVTSWFYLIEFVGALAGSNVSELVIDESSINSGEVIGSTYATGGIIAREFQLVDLGRPSAGTFTLTFNGETTSAIAYNAEIIPIKNALDALSGISNIFVAGIKGLFCVRFDDFPGINVSTLTLNAGGLTGATSPGVAVIQEGGPSSGADEVQSVSVYATSGTFTLTYSGQTTGAIAYNASAGTVETALEALSNISAVSVTGTGTGADPWLVTFENPAGDVVEMTGDGSSLAGGAGDVTTIREAIAPVDEVQTITVGVGVTSGTFTVTYSGQTTGALAYNATAGTIETALEALSTLDGVSVTGSAGGPWAVEFDGAAVQEQDVEMLVIDSGNIVGGAGTETLTLVTTQRSKGPEHFDDPDNWSGFRVPDSIDTIYFAGGSVNCLYGTKMQTTFTADAGTDTLTLDGGNGGDFVVDQKVRVRTTDTLPAGLAVDTDYYVLAVDYDAGTLTLSASSGGSAVNITDSGTGTHFIALRLTALHLHSRWSNAFLGLTERNEGEYYEYRNRSLAIAADAIIVGAGDGDSSPRMDIDTGPWQTVITLLTTGGSQESGLPAFRWKGTHASNAVTLIDGEFGASVYATESSVIATFVQRAGFAMIEDCTLGSIDKTGGELLADAVTLAGAVNIRG